MVKPMNSKTSMTFHFSGVRIVNGVYRWLMGSARRCRRAARKGLMDRSDENAIADATADPTKVASTMIGRILNTDL